MAVNGGTQFSVRMTPDLKARLDMLVQQKHKSLNAVVVDAVTDYLQREADKALFDAYTELGNDPEGCDVDFAFAAQAEVALRE